MSNLTFDEFAEFVRSWAHVSMKKAIKPATQFERDLGITGDDGDDLLVAAEKKYDVKFDRQAFGLAPDEYLFHSDGWGIAYAPISIFNCGHVRTFTVGE